jgi:hypothetical protein
MAILICINYLANAPPSVAGVDKREDEIAKTRLRNTTRVGWTMEQLRVKSEGPSGEQVEPGRQRNVRSDSFGGEVAGWAGGGFLIKSWIVPLM